MYGPGKRGRLVGYLIAETQKEAAETAAILHKEGCTYTVVSGAATSKCSLDKVIGELEPGDALVIPSLSALGRDARDIVRLIARLHRDSVGFKAIEENISSPTIGSFCLKLVRHDAKLEVPEDAGSAFGGVRRGGRPPKLTLELRHRIVAMSRSLTQSEIASALGLSQSTISRCLRQYRTASPDDGGHRSAARNRDGSD